MARRFCIILALVLTGNVSQAGFELGFTGGTYSAAQAGQTVTETIFLRQTGGDVLNSLGTFAFNLAPGAGGTTIAGFAGAVGFTGSFTAPVVNFIGAAGNVAAVGGQVNLGTVSFVLGTAGSVTPIDFTDINAANLIAGVANGVNTNFDGLVLPASSNVSVAAVPEPGSVVLVAMFAGVVGLRRRRRA